MRPTLAVHFLHSKTILNRTRPLTFRAASRCRYTAGSVCAAHLIILIIFIRRKGWQLNGDACTTAVALTNSRSTADAAATVTTAGTSAVIIITKLRVGI